MVEKAGFADIHLLQPKHFTKREQKDVDFSHWTASSELQIEIYMLANEPAPRFFYEIPRVSDFSDYSLPTCII